jgi:hypothetical protein
VSPIPCHHDFRPALERAVAAHETPQFLVCACGAKRLPTDDEIARLLHWTPAEIADAEAVLGGLGQRIPWCRPDAERPGREAEEPAA